MFTGTSARAASARVAAFNVEKQQKQAAVAELRRLAETTAAGGGRGGRGRVAWQAVATERERGALNQERVAALNSRIRELEAANAARGG